MPDFMPIGIVHSSLKTKGAPPIQSSFSQAAGSIEIFPEYRERLRDIGVFTHIIVLYYFHQSDSQALSEKPLVDGNVNHGIFATRHFNRPNPLGISYVALTGIEGGTLSVKGMDILDGTPVLDIKPYIPAFDAIHGAGSGWVTEQHVALIRAASVGVPVGPAGSNTR